MNRSYHEMLGFETFLERFEYLKLAGKVGAQTFGSQRYLNQQLYRLPEWKSIREKVIIRDESCDLACKDHQIMVPPVYIHHINPITIEDVLNRDPKVFDMDNLVMTTFDTHQAIHYGDPKLVKMIITERRPNDTCPWKE
jgi:hypothetical protein